MISLLPIKVHRIFLHVPLLQRLGAVDNLPAMRPIMKYITRKRHELLWGIREVECWPVSPIVALLKFGNITFQATGDLKYVRMKCLTYNR